MTGGTRLPRTHTAVVVFVFGFCSLSRGQGRELHLVRPPLTESASPAITDKNVLQQRVVAVVGLAALGDAPEIRLDLLPGLTVLATRSTELQPTSSSWVGVVDGVPDSSVILSVDNGILTGSVLGPFGIFRIRWQGNVYLMQEVATTGSDTGGVPGSMFVPFLENTDAFWTFQKKNLRESKFPYVLEADIFPHLVFHQNLSEVFDVAEQQRRGLDGLKEFAFSISGTPAVRLRMLTEESAPVRTPSYMPRGNFQFLWVRGLKDCRPESPQASCRNDPPDSPGGSLSPEQSVQRALAALTRISVYESHFIIGHHSNGQDGCLTSGQRRERPQDEVCVPPTPVTPGTINRKDGSFSTSYVRAGFNYSHNWMDDAPLMQSRREARINVEVEHHFRSWVDPTEIRNLYGRTRLTVAGSYAVRAVGPCRKRLEGAVSWTWNPGVVDPVDHGFIFGQVSCYPADNGGWGFFARYFVGQDYYNIGFLDNLARLHFGMTFNQSGFFRFRRPTTRVNR